MVLREADSRTRRQSPPDGFVANPEMRDHEPKSHAASSGVDVGRSAKITVRLTPHIAWEMAAQARAAGLLHGVYLSTLIAGAPAVMTGADHGAPWRR